MRVFAPPSGYLSLRDARNELGRQMHEGMSPHKKIKRLMSKGANISDFRHKRAAAKVLQEAIRSEDLNIYVELTPWSECRQLSAEICHAAMRPKDGGVLTFACIDRHPMAPFGLRWSVVQELTKATPLVKRKHFNIWMRKEERKKVWPCHEAPLLKRRRGAPPIIDEVIEIIEQLKESDQLRMKCECRSSLKSETIHALVLKQAPPTLKNKGLSIETTRRALEDLDILSLRSRRPIKAALNGRCDGCPWRPSIR